MCTWCTRGMTPLEDTTQVFSVSPHTIVRKLSLSMSCLSRPPSHCGSDKAIPSPPHHSPVCCHLSHQGHPTAPTLAHTTCAATPPTISTLSHALFVYDELVHLIDCTYDCILESFFSLSFLPHPCPSLPLPLPLPPLN